MSQTPSICQNPLSSICEITLKKNFEPNYLEIKNPFNKRKPTQPGFFGPKLQQSQSNTDIYQKAQSITPRVSSMGEDLERPFSFAPESVERKNEDPAGLEVSIVENRIRISEMENKNFFENRQSTLDRGKNEEDEHTGFTSIDKFERLENNYELSLKQKFRNLEKDDKTYGMIYKKMVKRRTVTFCDIREICLGDKNRETFGDFLRLRKVENIVFEDSDSEFE